MEETRQAYSEKLKDLEQDLLRMGVAVEEAIAKAVEALKLRNTKLAEDVMDSDDVIDELDVVIEMKCLQLIALQQPMAKDLRVIGTVLKIITDLERMGDHAYDIAKIAKTLGKDPITFPLDDLVGMAELSKRMVKHAVDSFINHDIDLAHKVLEDDDAVDEMYIRVFDRLTAFIKSEPDQAVLGANLLLVDRLLERISDHATNIVERVAYMETGNLKELRPTKDFGTN